MYIFFISILYWIYVQHVTHFINVVKELKGLLFNKFSHKRAITLWLVILLPHLWFSWLLVKEPFKSFTCHWNEQLYISTTKIFKVVFHVFSEELFISCGDIHNHFLKEQQVDFLLSILYILLFFICIWVSDAFCY